MKRALRFFILFIVLGTVSFLLSRFFQENADPIQVQLLGWRTRPIGVGLFVGIIFFSGILISFLLTFTTLIAKSIETGRMKRENLALQKMLEEKTHSSSSKT